MIPVRPLAVLLLVVLPAIPGAAASDSAANPVCKVTERLQPGAATAESCNPDIDPLLNSQDMQLLQLVSVEVVPQVSTPAPGEGATLSGDWSQNFNTDITTITQTGNQVYATNPRQSWSPATGTINGYTIYMFGLEGTVSTDFNTISWTNGALWNRVQQGACIDLDWHDRAGRDCGDWVGNGWCGLSSSVHENLATNGVSALDACCGCGGGQTPVPTPAPSNAPTPTLVHTPAHAVGDPHLTNVLGQRFDLTQPGKHVFILIPKGADAQDTLLRVDADIEHIGSACADMYIQYLTITGQWADEQRIGGYHYDAQEDVGQKGTNWMHVGEVDLKVVWGHTIEGIKYMNLFAKKLGQTGFPVGGLLGEDDHTFASTPTAACQTTVSLTSGASQAHGGSTAEAEF